ncbi:MAG: histidine--tRNA ligase [Bacteroidota bacterium]|nr:histidine--tRNA ligase [Bacteroidota bacterium]
MSKPGLPQGTRDFGSETVHKRQFIFQIIRKVFELSGFEPLETPAMENLETLLGKYGEEGDKLLFKILNNGLDHASKKDTALAEFEKILAGKNNKHITGRALRYDLTIPFARYVATHHNELAFPFKRYQIQPVWRADRPQKGRYREFFQCDADVVGSRSLLNEVELTQIYLDVFRQLNIEVEVHINHRKILAGLAMACGGADQLISITTAIDKLDKIGLDKVKMELAEKGLGVKEISIVQAYLAIQGTNEEKLEQLKRSFVYQSIQALASPDSNDKIDRSLEQGIQDIRYLLSFFPASENIVVDLSLARGLNYYTGFIFEIRARHISMGSIGGGGRYDDLTGLFGVPDIPGVGISFGVDRIYDVMEELKLFPATVQHSTEFLFFNLGPETVSTCFELLQQFRSAGIRSELYPEQTKFDRQFKYAEKKKIPFIIIIGTEELKTGIAKIKNLETGVQEECGLGELVLYAEKLNR